MLSQASLALLSALISSLSPPGEVSLERLLQCFDPESPPSLPSDQVEVPSLPKDDKYLLQLLGLQWPRKDSEYYIKTYTAQFNSASIIQPRTSNTKPEALEPAELNAVTSFGASHQFNSVLSTLSKESSFTIRSECVKSMDFGNAALKEKTAEDIFVAEDSDQLSKNSPSSIHQTAFQPTHPLATTMAKQGLIIEKATENFRRRFKLPDNVSGLKALPFERLLNCNESFLRPPHESCNLNNRYRRLDGTCNNLENPLWGASFTPFRRALLPQYGDGISKLRSGADGQPLPSARLVSTSINVRHNSNSPSFTILHFAFGQFLDHDLTSTPISKVSHPGFGDLSAKCCKDFSDACGLHRTASAEKTDVVDLPTLMRHIPEAKRRRSRECAPIKIPKRDAFYCTFRQRCMEFVRSAPAARCSLGPREQTNQLTAYLDGSVIYDTQPRTPSLRAFTGGLLATQLTQEGVEILPPSMDFEDGCNVEEKANNNRYCFAAGDHRVNEQRMLTLYQTVWAREHNRIARELQELNGEEWDDEKLFQETRRIVVAELQHIVYNEYLPTVLGPWISSELNLIPLEGTQYTTDYDPDINADIANSFAAAAFRFGHSEVADYLHRITQMGAVDADDMTTVFDNPFLFYDNGTIGDLARGGSAQYARDVDPYFSEAITNNLFKGENKFGLDLVALNLQRGRDHGVPGYNFWRELCELPKATSFEDLESDMRDGVLSDLEAVYSHVDDIDLFIGGLAERPLTGGLLGPTLTCIITDQFVRIKRGDRYWYEYQDMPGGAFTPEQLQELHSVSLARLLCDNVPELLSIQRWPLRHVSATNIKSLCNNPEAFPQLDLKLWQEQNGETVLISN